jgi:hypothetical protein
MVGGFPLKRGHAPLRGFHRPPTPTKNRRSFWMAVSLEMNKIIFDVKLLQKSFPPAALGDGV